MKAACSTLSPEAIHIPVLLQETIDALCPRAGGRYLDGTVGMGGHAHALLERIDGNAFLCGLDRDMQALELAQSRLAEFGDRVHLFHTRYSRFAEMLDSLAWDKIDGALLDIGVSSLQIDSADRGFSFHSDGPLDMRMDQNSGETPVSHLVNRGRVEELKSILERYGEEPLAGRIARAIVDARSRKPIETTRELAQVVAQAYPPVWRTKARNHPATRTFQALRIAVNDEIGELERFMDGILPRLNYGGRIAVISFHSLEDRIVKQRMRMWAKGCICPKHVPVCVCGHTAEVRIVTPKPIFPSKREVMFNPRSSSARLRVAEKLPPQDTKMIFAYEDPARRKYEFRRAARLARRQARGEVE